MGFSFLYENMVTCLLNRNGICYQWHGKGGLTKIMPEYAAIQVRLWPSNGRRTQSAKGCRCQSLPQWPARNNYLYQRWKLASFTTEKNETVQTNSTVWWRLSKMRIQTYRMQANILEIRTQRNSICRSARTFLLKRIGYIFLTEVNPSRKGMNRAVIVTPEEWCDQHT